MREKLQAEDSRVSQNRDRALFVRVAINSASNTSIELLDEVRLTINEKLNSQFNEINWQMLIFFFKSILQLIEK